MSRAVGILSGRGRYHHIEVLLVALAGVGVVCGIISVKGFIPYDHPGFAEYDHRSYLAMATEGIGAPGRASAPPFCWRVLSPLIASAWPGSPQTGFLLLSLLSVLACSVAMYALLRQAGMNHRWSLVGQASFFTFFWAAAFNLWNYLMVDALSLLIAIAGLLVLEREAWPAGARAALLGVLMSAGALNKESWIVLAAAGFVYWWASPHGGWGRRLVLSIGPVLPALVLMLGVRASVDADLSLMREFESYDLRSVFAVMLRKRLEGMGGWLAEAFVDPWGPLVLAPMVASPLGALSWLRAKPHRAAFLLVAVAQTFFGTSVGRLVIVALPVALLFTIERMASLPAVAGGSTRSVLQLLVLQCLFQFPRRTLMGLGVPPYGPSRTVLVAYAIRAAALLGGLALWWHLTRCRGVGVDGVATQRGGVTSTSGR